MAKAKLRNEPLPEQQAESIDTDIGNAMTSKFIQANIFYLLGILGFTLFFVFAVQGGVYHVYGMTSRALLFYLGGSLLFMTGLVCVSRGSGLYRYH
jgi:hypothetical protein